jgi:beta-lactamase superfamily II metal-dependent hydrolase
MSRAPAAPICVPFIAGIDAMPNALPEGVLNIRMYRVGFGDSFLLSFPVGATHQHVLVDCGAHVKGTLGNLEKVAQNVDEVTNHRLAVIVATHRHQDHIWGFERGRDTFRQMQIGQVWLPWVEELSNPEAYALWKAHEETRLMLEARLALAPASPRHDAVEAVLLNLRPNQVALEELRSRFGHGKDGVKYLYGGHPDLVGEAAGGIDGLVVKVLGPPKSEDFLKKMRAPKAERWARAAASDAAGDSGLFDSPFDPRWEDPNRGEYWSKEASGVFGGEERELFRSRMNDAFDLAFAMEDAVNNSSLALLFLFANQGLLMPGDAQWGNWQSWLQQSTGSEILNQTTVYKVGHHGSHNATPKSVVEGLPSHLTVLVPTQNTPFPTIPEPKLMAALGERSGQRVVRSDNETAALPAGCEPGPFWIDYRVEIT